MTPGEFVTCRIDRVMCHEAFTICALNLSRLGVKELFDPERVIVILDHYFPAPDERMARGHGIAKSLVARFGVTNFLGHAGICHQVLIERGLVRPGELVLGTDSHSTSYGALGAAGAGIGLTEMTWVLATGELWLQVPPTVRFALEGALIPGVMSKDVVLYLAGRFGTEVAGYKSIEYAGSAVREMSVPSRMTLSNMGVELGAKFAFCEADETTLAFLEAATGERLDPFGPDEEAVFEAVHEVDVSGLAPQVACPHNPGNVKPATDLGAVHVDQCFLGSCTNARVEDLAMAARILEGHRVHEGTRLLVTPASQAVYAEATRAGYTQVLLDAGAHITASGCGACPGGHSGVIAAGEVCLSSTNRNFRGRMGSPEAEVYLASPATVAAAAVAGRIVDPRELLGADA